MRIWDISPKYLCRQHLLGEHRELHAIWTIITKNKPGYRNHPETKRWFGKLKALYLRHELLAEEMEKRKYRHLSPLDKKLAKGKVVQNYFLHSIKQQKTILRRKPCGCFVK
jgi:hypothetical protein